jgi:hypothetical protein
MAFITDLWESIFTPGTTPSLILATHLSFGALLVTLIGLLFATRNIHFVILTVLASSLWAAITWFIKEVEAVKKNQQLEQQETVKSKAQTTAMATSQPKRISRKT